MMKSLIPECDNAGCVHERTGTSLRDRAALTAYTCQDGMILIAANQDTVFRRLAEAMGSPRLAQDPRYSTHGARVAHQTELDSLVDNWTRTMTVEATVWLMNKFGVPVDRIYHAPDMSKDEHFKGRESVTHIPHKTSAPLAMRNIAPNCSAIPGEVRTPYLERRGII